jgi:hypothetical protein
VGSIETGCDAINRAGMQVTTTFACTQDALAVILAIATLDGACDTPFGKRFVRPQID